MAVLHIDDMPDVIRDQIERLASAHGTTIEDEAVRLLRSGIAAQSSRTHQAELLAELRRRSVTPPAGTPDSVELLRDDRSR